MNAKMTSITAAAVIAALVGVTSASAQQAPPNQPAPTTPQGMMSGSNMMGQSGEGMMKMHNQMTKMVENCNKMMDSMMQSSSGGA